MLAEAGKCWQVVRGPAEYAGLVFDFVRSLKEFDNQFSTPCSPSGAADLIASRIPPGLELWSKGEHYIFLVGVHSEPKMASIPAQPQARQNARSD